MNIFKVITGNIVKWWQLTIMPILRIDNNNINHSQPQNNVPANSVQVTQSVEPGLTAEKTAQGETTVHVATSIPQQNIADMSSDQTGEMTDAQLVMERITREREEKRKKDMEKAQEEARLAAIMNANKVDVNAFIQAGKEARETQSVKEKSNENSSGADADAMARAEEIIARLNREAAEDEAKKAAEIEAAKKKAKETFGV